jgi:hypothetical protein
MPRIKPARPECSRDTPAGWNACCSFRTADWPRPGVELRPVDTAFTPLPNESGRDRPRPVVELRPVFHQGSVK